MNRPTGSYSSGSALARIRVVLSHTSHPGNIGAAARAMKTMGLARLSLVNPKHFPDPQAVARAADADDILEQAQICSSLDEALAGTVQVYALSARHRNLGPPALPAREAASDILGWAGEGEVALLFGNETAGLSNAEVQRCQRTVFIPANPDYSSLNLASAVQLLCYELRLAAFDGRPPVITRAVPFDSPPAPHEDIERFYQHLERVMVSSGFLDPQRPRRLLPKLRRLFGRAELERDEINILRGLLDAVERTAGEREAAGGAAGDAPDRQVGTVVGNSVLK
ncbi:MAG: tRNA (cytidine/uridine-2'-O-)-methyltransferase TrmJ [Candidatus Accumulibacter appositus]|uniref:tRNA (cytidine/uridine-2'-O-)-methyltransferase TrmJ n=1 Tax=Candidatus Accumulibacter appositus TaxID=1454003 RepID=A0A011PMU0_9PROT|nr:RNA methyltransferase [Accumulibacter sp.]EXI78175.1 MAG: tRNA (cytidine/uridine-2'-O-)-methyltransferase TrmJ [Candidatus Accumulibacter appositus]HRF04698.1 RNA methyltransferase [Accumulibacter sp.]